jgi:hypothetical protein
MTSTFSQLGLFRLLTCAFLVFALLGCNDGGAKADSRSSPRTMQAAQTGTATPANASTTPGTRAPGTIVERELAGSASPAEVDQIVARFLVYDNALPAEYPVDWYRITFLTKEEDGTPLEIVARVFVPVSDVPTEFPVYVFGAGTTGIGDHCAPSKEQPIDRSWGDFQAHLLSYASIGYIAIMPDYAGFNSAPRPHYYYVKEMHARVLLDAARAALRLPDFGEQRSPAHAANAHFFAGYSQGGHAAYSVRDIAKRYAPELGVKGVLSYGGRGEVQTLFLEFPSLGPYLLYAYQWYYGRDQVKVDQILQTQWLPSFEADVVGKCIDQIIGYYGSDPRQIYQTRFVDALEQGPLHAEFPELAKLLDRNDAGTSGQDIPVLILQGLADQDLDPQTQEAFKQKLCDNGARVTYNTYRGIPHVLTRQVSYRDTSDWMGTILRGEAPENDC